VLVPTCVVGLLVPAVVGEGAVVFPAVEGRDVGEVGGLAPGGRVGGTKIDGLEVLVAGEMTVGAKVAGVPLVGEAVAGDKDDGEGVDELLDGAKVGETAGAVVEPEEVGDVAGGNVSVHTK
jgi:hypothetical protein